jgi:small subunit ribosomal protein S6e
MLTFDFQILNKYSRSFYDHKLSDEVAGDPLGPEFKGYVFKVVGGQDKEGFPMRQGVLVNSRVKLLLNRGDIGFQAWRGRDGERRRKSVRGCIIGPDLSVLQLIIVRKGESELPGLTTETKPRTLGPKRASKIRKLFNLTKQDDVRKYVVKHKKKIGKKEVLKGPKIQRLVTPQRLRRKVLLRKRMDARREKTQSERKAYGDLLKKRKREDTEATRIRKKAKKQQQAQSQKKA